MNKFYNVFVIQVSSQECGLSSNNHSRWREKKRQRVGEKKTRSPHQQVKPFIYSGVIDPWTFLQVYLVCHWQSVCVCVCMWFFQVLTCFEQYDLVILTEIHEACDAFGKLHHILDCIGDVVGTLLPHPLCRLPQTEETC